MSTSTAGLPPIIEISHCGKSVFGFTLPDGFHCSKCGSSADAASVTVHESGVGPAKPQSLCVKPTIGNFSRMSRDSLLHVGVSDSRGRTFHFDGSGVHARDRVTFAECISFPLGEKSAMPAAEHWDAAIEAHSDNWESAQYHPMTNNCFSFAVGFLNTVGALGRCDHSRDSLVTTLLGSEIDRLEGYLDVWRKLQVQEFVVSDVGGLSSATVVRHSCDACTRPIPLDTNRHRCVDPSCQDVDLCEGCYRSGATPGTHKTAHRVFTVLEKRASFSCNSCTRPIAGSRWHCIDPACGDDFDLCSKCHDVLATPESHQSSHQMFRL